MSDGALTPASITFTTLAINGTKGHAAGSFKDVLCSSEDYGETVDTNSCRPIEGGFGTTFFVE